jgi:thioredoxin-like negative regulator of GroEL
MRVFKTNKKDFNKDVVESHYPAVVVFSSKDCYLCTRLKPILNQFAKLYNNRLLFFEVEVTKNEALSSEYLSDGDGVPTILLFKETNYTKVEDPEEPSKEYWYPQAYLNDLFMQLLRVK